MLTCDCRRRGGIGRGGTVIQRGTMQQRQQSINPKLLTVNIQNNSAGRSWKQSGMNIKTEDSNVGLSQRKRLDRSQFHQPKLNPTLQAEIAALQVNIAA